MGIRSPQRKTNHPPKNLKCWDSQALKCEGAKIEPPEVQDIPQEWTSTTVDLYTKDACWCQAIYLGISNHIKNEKSLGRYMKMVLSPAKMEKAAAPTKKEISDATWGTIEQLCEPRSQTPAYGVFRPCDTQKDKNCIFLKSSLAGDEGFGQPADLLGSQFILRDVVLPHESIHKLFDVLGFMSGSMLEVFEAKEANKGLRKPLTREEWCRYIGDMVQFEEKIVGDIETIYFGKNRIFRDTLNKFPEGLRGQLLKSCARLGRCDRSNAVFGAADMPPYGITLMTSPGSLLPPLPSVDFNNDGIRDFVDDLYAPHHLGLDYRYDVPGTLRIRPKLWPYVTPHLQSPNPLFNIWLSEYWECPVPKSSPRTTAWRFDRASFRIWPNVFTRFFNADRSMYFIPNQKVEWQMGGVAHRGIVQSIVVLLDPQLGSQEGRPYVEMEKCQVVPLDHLRWVMTDGRSVDMQKMFSGALHFMGPLPSKSARAEDELSNLVRTAHWASSQSYLTSPNARRDEAIRVLKSSPLFDQLIYAWEDVVLMALKLPPQDEPGKDFVPSPDSLSCNHLSLNP